MTSQKRCNLIFDTCVLPEQTIIENIGLSAYVRQLLNRRWMSHPLSGFVFAIPRSMITKYNDSLFLDPRINPIGNDEFFCTIVLIDPGQSIVLVIMNQLYAFVRHCLASETQHPSHDISIIVDQIDRVTIVALSFCSLTVDRISGITHVPDCAIGTIHGLTQICNAHILSQSSSGSMIDYLIRPQAPFTIIQSIPCDYCPASPSVIARKNLPITSIWRNHPYKTSPDPPRFKSPKIVPSLPMRSYSSSDSGTPFQDLSDSTSMLRQSADGANVYEFDLNEFNARDGADPPILSYALLPHPLFVPMPIKTYNPAGLFIHAHSAFSVVKKV